MGPLRAYLAAALPDAEVDLPLSARLLAGGRSNVSYVLTQGDRSWVLRRPPLGHVMATAHDMRREHKVLSGLARVGFAAPTPLALCHDEKVIGAPFMVMEFVSGRVIATADDAASLTAVDASTLCGEMVDKLAELHEVNVAAAGLGQLGRPEGYLTRQVRRWGRQWEVTKTRELAGVGKLSAWIERRVDVLPASMPFSVVHGDYRLDNLIISPATVGISAVLDWEMSTLGDPVADLAVALVYWSRPGEQLRHRVPVANGVTDGPGFWDRSALVSSYAQQSGRDLSHLDICLALACFKLAVIMESIHYRSVHGHQLGAAALDIGGMADAADALVELGHAVTTGGLDALSR